MTYDPRRHHRQSIRLRGYDYTRAGHYFVTICTHRRLCLFDTPALRQIAEQQWVSLGHAGARGAAPGRVSVDTWVVMPDHVHAIIVIAPHATVLPDGMRPPDDGDGDDVGAAA